MALRIWGGGGGGGGGSWKPPVFLQPENGWWHFCLLLIICLKTIGFFSATDSGCPNRGWVCGRENPWSSQHSIIRGINCPWWWWCIIFKKLHLHHIQETIILSPASKVEFAFSLPEKKFMETFGISKPGMADLIITSCKVTLWSKHSRVHPFLPGWGQGC